MIVPFRLEYTLCLAMVLISIFTAGCVSSKNDRLNPPSPSDSFVQCEEPRPEICTMDYNPVCGQRADGHEKTYSNACTACSDKTIVQYKPGSCL